MACSLASAPPLTTCRRVCLRQVLQLLLCSSIVTSFTAQLATPGHCPSPAAGSRSFQYQRPFLTSLLAVAEPDDSDAKITLSSSSISSSTNYTMQVSYEGQSCTISVQPGETILAALERSANTSSLCLPEMPADCRRGNCLTCTASHHPDSQKENIWRGEDGLAPCMSQCVAEKGYVLTCSSSIHGNGVHLELGENHQLWDDVYRVRIQDEESQRIGREAMARVIRKAAERNVDQWTEDTEEVYTRDMNMK
jgi:hypothetical protein